MLAQEAEGQDEECGADTEWMSVRLAIGTTAVRCFTLEEEGSLADTALALYI
jgi:hypothetical protein